MKKLALFIGALALPVVSFAAVGLSNIETMTQSVGRIVNALIPIVFALAVLVFFWGLVMYIFAKEQDKEQAKKTMIWGVVAIFVMATVWGLVRFIGDAFGITDNSQPTTTVKLPTVSN